MFSLEYGPSTLDNLPSTDGQANRTSKPDDGAVPPGFLQLRAGQLSRTLAARQIPLQSRDTCVYADDSILSKLPGPSGDAV